MNLFKQFLINLLITNGILWAAISAVRLAIIISNKSEFRMIVYIVEILIIFACLFAAMDQEQDRIRKNPIKRKYKKDRKHRGSYNRKGITRWPYKKREPKSTVTYIVKTELPDKPQKKKVKVKTNRNRTEYDYRMAPEVTADYNSSMSLKDIQDKYGFKNPQIIYEMLKHQGTGPSRYIK